MTNKELDSDVVTAITEIDGSLLEGGGQILRISSALSVLLKQPIKTVNIRAGRKDAGLKAQHLTGIELLGKMSKSKMSGTRLKSTEVSFSPKCIQSGRFEGDTKTAGSICLLLQTALPCMLFANGPCELDLRGGTNAANAPQIDYFLQVFTPVAAHFGIKTEVEILKRGYYPRGGGEVYIKTQPITGALNCVDLTDFGSLKSVRGRAFVAGHLPFKIAEAMAATTKQLFLEYSPETPVEIEVIQEPEHTFYGAGTGIIIIAETTSGRILSGSALGKKGVAAADVAKEAYETLKHDIDCQSCVDQYMQDQLIIFMALAKGKSSVRCGPLTMHTKTAIHFTELMTGVKFVVMEIVKDRSYLIECDGIGFERAAVKSNKTQD